MFYFHNLRKNKMNIDKKSWNMLKFIYWNGEENQGNVMDKGNRNNYPTYARVVKLKERFHEMKQTSMILIPTDYSFNSQSIISVHTVGVLFTRWYR